MRVLTRMKEFVARLTNDPDHYHSLDQVVLPGETDLEWELEAHGDGRYLELYDQAARDPQVLTALNKRTEAVICAPWSLDPGSNDATAAERSDMIAKMLRRRGFGFSRMCFSLLFNSALYGLGAVELMWERDGQGLWAPKAWTGVRTNRMRWVAGQGWHIRTLADPHKGAKARYGQLIVLRMRDDGGAYPYGRGLGRILWRLAFIRRHLLVAWAEGADRTGSPSVIGKRPPQMAKDAQQAFDRALTAMRSSGTVAIPADASVELLQRTGGAGGGIYSALWSALDASISKVVLGETLTTEVGERGSYSAGKVHADVAVKRAMSEATLLGETLDEQLLSLIYHANWSDGEPPAMRHDFFDPGALEKVAGAASALEELGYVPVDRKAWARQRLGAEWTHEPSARTSFSGRANFAESDPAADLRRRERRRVRLVEAAADNLAQRSAEVGAEKLSGAILTAVKSAQNMDELIESIEEVELGDAGWEADAANALLASHMAGRHTGQN